MTHPNICNIHLYFCHSAFISGRLRRLGFSVSKMIKMYSFQDHAASASLICFLWNLYRLCPMDTRKSYNRTEFIPLLTILLYHQSYFMIPKVLSAWIDRHILRQILNEKIKMLRSNGVDPLKLPCGYVPVDMDVSPFGNSKIRKEGVSQTYKSCDDYAPMFVYIGSEG